jgi:hypothetical protein
MDQESAPFVWNEPLEKDLLKEGSQAKVYKIKFKATDITFFALKEVEFGGKMSRKEVN